MTYSECLDLLAKGLVPALTCGVAVAALYFANRNFANTLKHQTETNRHDRVEAEKERRRQAVADLASSAYAILSVTAQMHTELELFDCFDESQLKAIAGEGGPAGVVRKFMDRISGDMPPVLTAYYSSKCKFYAIVPSSERASELEVLDKAIGTEMHALEARGAGHAAGKSNSGQLNKAIFAFVEAQSERIRIMQ